MKNQPLGYSCFRSRFCRPLKGASILFLLTSLALSAAEVHGQATFQWLGHLLGEPDRDEVEPGTRPRTFESTANAITADGNKVVGNFVWTPSGTSDDSAFIWENGAMTAIPQMTRANWISPDGSVILGEKYVSNGLRAVRLENGVEVPAYDGEVITLSETRSAYLAANGKWKAIGESNSYRVRNVSADEKVFVGSKVLGPFEWRAATWTADGETILPMPPGYTMNMEALAVSSDGTTVVGSAEFPQNVDSDLPRAAFIWTQANGTRLLYEAAIESGLEWNFNDELFAANAITPDGRVVVGVGDWDGEFLEPFRLAFGPPAPGNTVNSTADRPRDASRADSGTGEFITGGDPEVTLRSAIEAVNAGLSDRIEFDIPDTPIPTISVGSALPAITRPVEIDGATQSGKMVEVRGSGLGAYGLDLRGGDSVVRGLIISGFTGDDSAGIRIMGSEGSVIAGNWIGVSKEGDTAAPMSWAVVVQDSARNVIGGSSEEDRNIVYGTSEAIAILGAASDENQVFGNRVGLGMDGKALGDAGSGVVIKGGDANQIGGPGDAGNQIIGDAGIAVSGESAIANTKISGNRIGLEADGRTAARTAIGIVLSATKEAPLSNTEVSNNLVAGTEIGLFSISNSVTGTQITGNTFGLDFNNTGHPPQGMGEVGQSFGIRIDGSSMQTISDNVVAGHEFNVLVSGNLQFFSSPGEDTDGDGDIDEPGYFNPKNILDPIPVYEEDELGSDVTLTGNTIGLNASAAVPEGRVQGVGVSVFGSAASVHIKDNLIAGHVLCDVYLQDGEMHSVGGNRIGTAGGANHGGQIGIWVQHAKDVTIGSTGETAGNVIGKEGNSGILVTGKAENIMIKGNKIGTDIAATSAWPNQSGVTIVSNEFGDTPSGISIEENIISGNIDYGVASEIKNPIEMKGNRIGVDNNGLALPNNAGVIMRNAPFRSEADTIAHNTASGIAIFGAQTALISSPSIYLNGDGTHLHGILYESPPFDAPERVVALRSKPDENGQVTVIIAVAPSPADLTTIEAFANRKDERQGRTPIVKKARRAGEPLVEELKVPANSTFATMANVTATYTIGGRTSEFSVHAEVEPIILPDFHVSAGTDGQITLIWSLLDYYRVVSAPSPSGPWTPMDLKPKQQGGQYVVSVPVGSNPTFFRLELDPSAVFDLN